MHQAITIIVLYLALAANVHGLGRAKDGDSLYVGEREVRLFGIDAPEFDQFCERDGQQWACGQEAMDQLRALVTGRDVSCTSMGQDDFGRMLGRCTVNGMDVNQRMVELGLAVAYRHYSADYVPAEERAKAARAGIWAGTFQMPYDYRLGPSDRPQQAVRSGCNIKGNRGSNGWIYHMPGQKYYAVTKAEEMFCSEADAQAAGYRKARTR